jgi:hypothetical protein
MVNVLFWFIIKPTGPDDSIRTIVTSMAAVGTTTMTLRIILGVRGSLQSGGTFSGTYSSQTAHSSSHRRSLSRGLASARSQAAAHVATKDAGPTYTVDVGGASKDGAGWNGDDIDAQSVRDKESPYALTPGGEHAPGVKITVDTETDYESLRRQR